MPYTPNALLISTTTHEPSKNIHCVVFDKANARSDQLGSGVTDAEGRVAVALDLIRISN